MGVRKIGKRARRELWGGQESSEEKIPNNSHRIQRKWLFMDATKESFGFEMSFLTCTDLVKIESWGLGRSMGWPAGKHRGLEPSEAKTQPHAATSLKG